MAPDPSLKDLIERGDCPVDLQLDETSDGQPILDILYQALLGDNYKAAISPAFPHLRLQYSTVNQVTLGIIPLDFYAWKLRRNGEEIAVCVAGTITDKTFHSLARGRLRDHADKIIIERGDRSEATFNLRISGVEIKLRYHQNPLISRWSGIKQADVEETKKSLPWQSKGRLGELQRTQEVATQLELQDFETARQAYLMYHMWAKNLGLDPTIIRREHILCMAMYGLFAQVSQTACDRLHLPVPNDRGEIADTAKDFGLTNVKLKEQSWDMLTSIIDRVGYQDLRKSQWHRFLRYNCHIIIQGRYWGSSTIASAKWILDVEDIIRNDIMKILKDIPCHGKCHLWPAPFVDNEDSESIHQLKPLGQHLEPIMETHEDSLGRHDLTLSWIISFVDPQSSSRIYTSGFEEKDFPSAFASVNDNHSFTEASWALGGLEKRFHPFQPYPVAIPEDIRKLILEEDGEAFPAVAPPSQNTRSKANSKAARSRLRSETPTTVGGSPVKLRPAQDILHRIRHDTTYKTDNIVIGYLDRHTGMKEIPFDWWTEEKTAEEFIPQSRIRFFKRKGEKGEGDLILWDRERRVDLVFGSGVQE